MNDVPDNELRVGVIAVADALTAVASQHIINHSSDNSPVTEQCESDELQHHGVKGMKWGVRKKRAVAVAAGTAAALATVGVASKLRRKKNKSQGDNDDTQREVRKARNKALISAGIVATTSILAAIGAKKLLKSRKTNSSDSGEPFEEFKSVGKSAVEKLISKSETRSMTLRNNPTSISYQLGYMNHSDELQHHGVKGMKWGVRRARREARTIRKMALRANDDNVRKQLNDSADKRYLEADQMERDYQSLKRARQIRMGVVAASVALAAVAAYKIGKGGSLKDLGDKVKDKAKPVKDAIKEKRARKDEVWGKVGDDRWNSFGSGFAKKASRGASIVNRLLSSKSSAGPIKLDDDTEFYQ